MSSIDEIKPGETLTTEQKEKLAKENLEVSLEANRLAMEHRQRDAQEGTGEPVIKTVADSLKSKLENEEFDKK